MSDAISVVELQDQPVVAVEKHASTIAMPIMMGKTYGRLLRHIESKGTRMEGMPYAMYKNVNWQEVTGIKGFWAKLKIMFHKWEFDIGMPVAQAIEGEGDIVAKAIPGGKYLKATHFGPYQGVSQTYDKMMAYANENNLNIGKYAFEMYINDPRQVKKEEIETEVFIAIN
jgi:effector-binding domain-containing protein